MAKCNCESELCKTDAHWRKGKDKKDWEFCGHDAGKTKSMYVGEICDECAKHLPKKYLMDDKEVKSMKLSEKLLIVANWLEDSENDLIVNADRDESCLDIVANALVKASKSLKEASNLIKETEPTIITVESLDEMAALADAFDESGDELLKKQASVLDEILLTIAAPRNAAIQFRDTQDDRIEQLKKKYKDTKSKQDEMNKVSDTVKEIEKSPFYKSHKEIRGSLSTRYCPTHAGVSTIRVGEYQWQCPLDKHIYNYETGFTLDDGSKVPGGSVDAQILDRPDSGETIFDTRNSRLGIDINDK